MELGLRHKRALVTGSSAGLGRAIAEMLAAEGASVVVHGRDADRHKRLFPRSAPTAVKRPPYSATSRPTTAPQPSRTPRARSTSWSTTPATTTVRPGRN